MEQKNNVENCRRCGKEITEIGMRSEGTDTSAMLCPACVNTLCPEETATPVAMDGDGNLYVVDKTRNCMVIFFSYGEVPYTSCTEVSLEDEEECGCDFGFGLY